MSRPWIGLIRVLTTDDPGVLGAHERLLRLAYPGLAVRTACIPDQPRGVHDDVSLAAAAPKVARLARELAEGGTAAVIISCCADPGLELCRAAVGVPVIGAGSAAAAIALAPGGPVGVLGLTAEVPLPVARVLGRALCRSAAPQGVRTTLDLMRADAMDACLKAARELVDAGAQVILVACTGMSTAGVTARLRRELPLPVVDPVLAAGGVAITMLAQEGVIAGCAS
ncbi:MAG TPA: aspartate/glutamate racemase family protein [Bacillota bacterium]|nr:aspartate/glutamate racemase family protein [Bacillota bacterium]